MPRKQYALNKSAISLISFELIHVFEWDVDQFANEAHTVKRPIAYKISRRKTDVCVWCCIGLTGEMRLGSVNMMKVESQMTWLLSGKWVLSHHFFVMLIRHPKVIRLRKQHNSCRPLYSEWAQFGWRANTDWHSRIPIAIECLMCSRPSVRLSISFGFRLYLFICLPSQAFVSNKSSRCGPSARISFPFDVCVCA